MPKSTSVTLAVAEKTLPMSTITGRTDRHTDRQTDRLTDRVRRNIRPPPRDEGRIIIYKNSKRNKQCAYMYIGGGRDVWSGLGVTMLVGNGVGQSL